MSNCQHCGQGAIARDALGYVCPDCWEEGNFTQPEEDDQPKLLPCPFCGGRAHYQPAYGVKCRGCGANVPCRYSDIHDLWNTRAPISEANHG